MAKCNQLIPLLFKGLNIDKRRMKSRYILSCWSCKAASIAAWCCWYVAAVDTTVVAGVSIVWYVVGAVIVGM